jgi:hypothetical protein
VGWRLAVLSCVQCTGWCDGRGRVRSICKPTVAQCAGVEPQTSVLCVMRSSMVTWRSEEETCMGRGGGRAPCKRNVPPPSLPHAPLWTLGWVCNDGVHSTVHLLGSPPSPLPSPHPPPCATVLLCAWRTLTHVLQPSPHSPPRPSEKRSDCCRIFMEFVPGGSVRRWAPAPAALPLSPSPATRPLSPSQPISPHSHTHARAHTHTHIPPLTASSQALLRSARGLGPTHSSSSWSFCRPPHHSVANLPAARPYPHPLPLFCNPLLPPPQPGVSLWGPERAHPKALRAPGTGSPVVSAPAPHRARRPHHGPHAVDVHGDRQWLHQAVWPSLPGTRDAWGPGAQVSGWLGGGGGGLRPF